MPQFDSVCRDDHRDDLADTATQVGRGDPEDGVIELDGAVASGLASDLASVVRAEDALQVGAGLIDRPVCVLWIMGRLGKALVVLDKVVLQERIGGHDVTDSSHPQSLDEAVLEGFVDPLDPALDLG